MGFPKYEIRRSSDNQFYFNLKAVNGYTILTSERYTTKQNCVNGIQSCKTNSPDNSNYERLTASNGQYYFTLRATNYQVIGRSEMYTTIGARDNGIEAVKRDGPVAGIEDYS